MDARVVLITYPEQAETPAWAFARQLVEQGLAACVNLAPVTSVYRWQGRVEQDREVLLVVKTRRQDLEALERFVHEHHPYTVPEFVVLAPDHVAPAYLKWLLEPGS